MIQIIEHNHITTTEGYEKLSILDKSAPICQFDKNVITKVCTNKDVDFIDSASNANLNIIGISFFPIKYCNHIVDNAFIFIYGDDDKYYNIRIDYVTREESLFVVLMKVDCSYISLEETLNYMFSNIGSFLYD